jgi:hypothetical protein
MAIENGELIAGTLPNIEEAGLVAHYSKVEHLDKILGDGTIKSAQYVTLMIRAKATWAG